MGGRRNPQNLPRDTPRNENDSPNDSRRLSKADGRDAASKMLFLPLNLWGATSPGPPWSAQKRILACLARGKIAWQGIPNAKHAKYRFLKDVHNKITILGGRRNSENLPRDKKEAENEARNDPRRLSRAVGREAAHKTPFFFTVPMMCDRPGTLPGTPKSCPSVFGQKKENLTRRTKCGPCEIAIFEGCL